MLFSLKIFFTIDGDYSVWITELRLVAVSTFVNYGRCLNMIDLEVPTGGCDAHVAASGFFISK